MNNFQRRPSFCIATLAIAAALCLVGMYQASGQETVGDLRAALAPHPADALVQWHHPAPRFTVVDAPPPPVQVGGIYGDFILQPLFHDQKTDRTPPRGSRLVDEAELRMAGVDGKVIRIIPSFLEVNGRWDFSFVDANVAHCRNTGDRYKMILAGGFEDPLSAKSKTFYRAAHAALGARYGNDPLFVGVSCTGGSLPGHSEELFTGGGRMPKALLDWNKELIDICTIAYPNQVKIIAGSANDPAAMRELILYGIKRTGGKFLYKSNAMQAKPNLTWEGNQLVVFCMKNGGMGGWEMVGSYELERDRFGGTYEAMLQKVETLTAQGGKKRGERMLDHYPPDIKQLAKIQ